MTEHKDVKLKIPSKIEFNWSKLSTVIVFIATIMSFSFWLYADKHNDERYVGKTEYKQDQDRLSRDISEIKEGQKRLIDYLLKK